MLDPRKAKRRVIADTLGPLGRLQWKRVAPMSGRGARYDRAREVADEAMAMSKARGHSALRRRLTHVLLVLQYFGTKSLFHFNPEAIAVCWNGLNGSRRVYMQAAKDAGVRTLFFELAPLKGRVTVDPRGVNFANSLPRAAAPYLDWAQTARDPARSWRDVSRDVTQRAATYDHASSPDAPPLTDPFVLVALQTPGDSQLRLFGGAFPTVEGFAQACIAAAQHLPAGWHMRIKEHPTAPTDVAELVAEHGRGRVFLDNATDTFAQVAASRAVITVNSSVGLEAMMFERPVVACGQAFWAIDGVAETAVDAEALADVCTRADRLSYDTATRDAFLDFLDQVYYPPKDGSPDLIKARLDGPDSFGFWGVA